jgi:hypothetical protein
LFYGNGLTDWTWVPALLVNCDPHLKWFIANRILKTPSQE